MLLVVVVVLAVALLLSLAVMWRVFANVGPMDLETYARRERVVYVPVNREMVDELSEWTKPVRLRIEAHTNPLLATLIITSNLGEPK